MRLDRLTMLGWAPGKWHAVLPVAIIVLVFAMVASVVSGFAFINAQQERLIELRQGGTEMRIANDALIAADAGVMHLVMGDGGADLAAVFSAIAKVEERRDTAFRQLEPYLSAKVGDAVAASALVDRLTSAWTEAVKLVNAGEADAARRLLEQRGSAALVGAIRSAVAEFLEVWNGNFAVHESRISTGTWVVLLLEVCSGTLAVSGLVYAFRSGAAEASGRAAAVASAVSSREQVARLFDMADVLQSAADHTDANAVLKATAAELVPGLSGALYVFNNSRDRLVLSTSWDRPLERALAETISPNQCWALKRGKPHLSAERSTKLCCEHHSGDETVLEIPMIARGEILGLLQLFAHGAAAEARLTSVSTMGSALADGMSLALANIALREKLRNQALRDALTGLYNRRYMEDTLQRFVRLAEREGREIAVIMIDLDHFKRLNDEHGHATGDAVLRDTALAIVGSLRETDVACRYGGEELIVIMPDCDFERAADKAETIRLRIEALSETHGAAISASFGVSSIPHTAAGAADVVSTADAALYRAKQGGRNRVAKAPRRAALRLQPDPEVVPLTAAE